MFSASVTDASLDPCEPCMIGKIASLILSILPLLNEVFNFDNPGFSLEQLTPNLSKSDGLLDSVTMYIVHKFVGIVKGNMGSLWEQKGTSQHQRSSSSGNNGNLNSMSA